MAASTDSDDEEVHHYAGEDRQHALDIADRERRDGFRASVKEKRTALVTGDWEPVELPTPTGGLG